ncbi:hypothetical protein CU633_16600 [Bacillus sp. V3-13]|uniref:hypothetical protein n=1 Tax=Bacillus sp. V3-13 TaxID=2053728 RepID=UPI000C768F3C|nr:hypothetical protein [Bacillus sp. V3-13]PLR76311.1 hypothetical protein CU633_16600 [Bacillus sp. V3-13]
MKKKGLKNMSPQMIKDVEKIRKGFQLGSRVGVTQLGRSTKWREELERFGIMEVVERNQTAAILLDTDVFKALLTYLEQSDEELEQAQVESLFGHRRHTDNFSSGEELATKAKESLRARREDIRGLLDGDQR